MAIKGARARDSAIVPHLLVRNAAAAAEFYRKAFGAAELYRSQLPDGGGLHIHMRVGREQLFMITDETPPGETDDGHFAYGLASPQTLCGTSTVIELVVEDADATYERAVKEGATPKLPLFDAFWGDRYGWVVDPFGHIWAVAQVLEEITPDEVQQRMSAMMSTMHCKGGNK